MVGRSVAFRRTVAAGVLVASLVALVYTTQASADRAARLDRSRRINVALAEGRYRNDLFTDVTVKRDVVYRETVDHDGKPVALRLDVYQPTNDHTRQRAAVIWMHSGGYTQGDKTEFADWSTELARRGYVTLSINYRLRPKMQWLDMTQRAQAVHDADDDAMAAIDWVRANADELGVDPGLIFAGGYSAGGIMAFNLAYPGEGRPQAKLAGVVAIAGFSYAQPRPGDNVPMLAFHGTNDPLVPYGYARDECAAANGVGDPCELVTYQGGGHDIGFVDRAALFDKTVDFLTTTIGNAA